ncbi:MAG: beta-N-acetylglucosaminidase domain-containing protein [bacterium]
MMETKSVKIFTQIVITILGLFSSICHGYVLMPTPQWINPLGIEEKILQIDKGKVFLSKETTEGDPIVLKALREIFPAANLTDKEIEALPTGSTLVKNKIVSDESDLTYTITCSILSCDDTLRETMKMQGYSLDIKDVDGRNLITIQAMTPMGQFYGVKTLKQLVVGETIPTIVMTDFPLFMGRGVLEGFYGEPWDKAKRKEMIRWMSDYKFDIFMYAPKDDNKLRFSWRMPYTKKELDEIKELYELAKENFVEYCWALSPGMSLNFARDKDFEIALKKFRSVMEQGVKCLAIAFDDTNLALTPYDRDKYKTYWEGQVDFANRFIEELLKINPEANIAFVPNDYWGNLAPTSEYLRYIGRHLDKRYRIGWTGDKIIPETVTPSDAQFYEFFIGRQPLLGDNYPVTDSITTAGGRISFGPLRGRDASLYRYIHSYVANAMPLPFASKPAYVTIADYAWNPYRYDAETAWVNAWKSLAGEKNYEPFYFFAQQNASSFIWEYEAMELTEATRAFWMAYEKKPDYDFAASAAALRKFFQRFSTIGDELDAAKNQETEGIIDEIKLWIDKLELYGQAGLISVDLLEAKFRDGAVDQEKLKQLEQISDEAAKSKAVVTKMVMKNHLDRALAVLKDLPVPEPEKFQSIMKQE